MTLVTQADSARTNRTKVTRNRTRARDRPIRIPKEERHAALYSEAQHDSPRRVRRSVHRREPAVT